MLDCVTHLLKLLNAENGVIGQLVQATEALLQEQRDLPVSKSYPGKESEVSAEVLNLSAETNQEMQGARVDETLPSSRGMQAQEKASLQDDKAQSPKSLHFILLEPTGRLLKSSASDQASGHLLRVKQKVAIKLCQRGTGCSITDAAVAYLLPWA